MVENDQTDRDISGKFSHFLEYDKGNLNSEGFDDKGREMCGSKVK